MQSVAMLRKKFSSLFSTYPARRPRHLLSFSTAAGAAEDQDPPPPKTSFIAQYLIDSCGFSPEMAARSSKHITHIKSPSNPDSVIHFLKSTGLDDAQITSAIVNQPRLFCLKVEPTLKAKLSALQELCFSKSDLVHLIHLCPNILTLSTMKPRIEFWRDFYPTNDDFFKAIKRDHYLLSRNVDELLLPNISLLRSYGLSGDQIGRLVIRAPRLITKKLASLKELLRRAGDLGAPPGSSMLIPALCVVHSNSEAMIESKIRLLKSLGCCELAIRSRPKNMFRTLMLSEKKLKDNMDFLVKEAGCDPSYVLYRPPLLGLSVERRLIPRFRVLQILKEKELAGGDSDLYAAMVITDKNFLDKFVLPHKETVPEIHKYFVTACAGIAANQSNCS